MAGQPIVSIIFGLLIAVHGAHAASLVFFYGPEYKSSTAYNLTEAVKVLDHEEFVHNQTHCYLHGYGESLESESIAVITDAYSKRGTINLLVLDWAKLASEFYPIAALENIEKLSDKLADMFLSLFKAGLNKEEFTIIGHSLGGQLTGMTGRKLISKTNGIIKFTNMVVLDPAFPLFYNKWPLVQTVNMNDAEFLQTIHTDIGTFGQPLALGHVDFWPNGGKQGQPGCPSILVIPFSNEDECSHQRSWRYWAESVIPGGRLFWAFPAESYQAFLSEDIESLKDKAIPMGLQCPRNASGNYYLKTNSEPPFALGFDGY